MWLKNHISVEFWQHTHNEAGLWSQQIKNSQSWLMFAKNESGTRNMCCCSAGLHPIIIILFNNNLEIVFCMHQTNIIMKKMFAKNVDLIRHDKLKQNACWFFAKKIVKILLHSNIKLNARFATRQGYHPLNYCHLFLFCFFLRIILVIAQLETLKT